MPYLRTVCMPYLTTVCWILKQFFSVALQEAMHAEAHLLVETSYGSLLVRTATTTYFHCPITFCIAWSLLSVQAQECTVQLSTAFLSTFHCIPLYVLLHSFAGLLRASISRAVSRLCWH